ncbi:hypothetical protein BRD56_02205 [Thermoplasmatales archaeon SW_10_69_26]|nr:MAG: hypothetical protein BRD56_02205 [Thermoplasmatales archaeon SW_10_69_26]
MIGIVPGTRPEIIKMNPSHPSWEDRGLDVFILRAGQHSSYELDEDLLRPAPTPRRTTTWTLDPTHTVPKRAG